MTFLNGMMIPGWGNKKKKWAKEHGYKNEDRSDDRDEFFDDEDSKNLESIAKILNSFHERIVTLEAIISRKNSVRNFETKF